ncbi:membrane protein [Agarivorans albus MKT 106]|uniref:Membrane protein n=1 Tax=Agarivorans albus MKT 106 TaxID=1331007 RepID=R9PN78_AGAAL|nr:membrane protein [Agarivorans albus MKT 106]
MGNGVKVTHILWNMLGLLFPLLVAAISIPNLIESIGLERFGFIALAWAAIGYASILDLGIGRAVTQKVASYIGANQHQCISPLVSTALTLTSIFSVISLFAVVVFLAAGLQEYIPREDVTNEELTWSIALLALAIPLQALSATYKGVNEAYLNFKGISVLRMLLGAANFGLPFIVSMYSQNLSLLIASLVVSRLAAFFVYRAFANKQMDEANLLRVFVFELSLVRELFTFSGWVTLSSIIGPFLVQVDRFFISILLSASAVTLYVIPYEVSVQSLVVVGAISSVAFPTISRLLTADRLQASAVFKRWLIIVIIGMAFVCGLLFWLMPYLLRLWVGQFVDDSSILVGQIMCVGVYLNAIGAMLYAWLHANGKTKITALAHCIELPIFVALLYFSIGQWGIVGAAIAWVIRVLLDTSLLSLATLSLAKQYNANSEDALDVS